MTDKLYMKGKENTLYFSATHNLLFITLKVKIESPWKLLLYTKITIKAAPIKAGKWRVRAEESSKKWFFANNTKNNKKTCCIDLKIKLTTFQHFPLILNQETFVQLLSSGSGPMETFPVDFIGKTLGSLLY